jgi:PAS domain S-box-containing protein
MSAIDAGWLAAIIESADDSIVSETLDGIVVSWNPGAERLFGYSAADMVGRPVATIFAPERLTEEVELARRVARGQRVEHYEAARVRKDGGRINVWVTVSPILDERGRVGGVSRIARNVSARAATAALLEERRRWLEGMLTSLGDAVIAVDAQGGINFMNHAATALTGWTSEQAVGRMIDAVVWLVDAASRRRLDNPAISALTTGGTASVAHHALLIARDGTEYPVVLTAAVMHDEARASSGAVMILHDVSEVQQASRVQSHLRAIIESSDDAIASKTLDGVVLTWNAGAERLFGYAPADIVGRSITMLVPADRLAEETDFLGRLAQGQRIRHFETVRVRKDGTLIDVSVSLSPIYDTAGGVVAVSTIARDITAQKRIERERQAVREREQQALHDSVAANRSKDEFIATVSHELRTPVYAILGWSQLLSSGRLGPAESTRAAEVIIRNARVQVRLIDELLDLSASMVGKIKLDVRRVDLVSVVRAAVESIQPSTRMKSLRLDVQITDDVPVMGDVTRLQQVVWNLLTNAVKFTPSGGRIEVLLTNQEPLARLQITDTGAGIAPDVLPTIFDRFRQADASTTRRHGGLGLGLAIVRRLVELHGGSVWAESEGVGCGARFTVELPLLPGHRRGIPAALMPGPTATRDLPSLIGVRALVVDDNEDSRRFLGHVLSLDGAVVDEAGSAADALKVLKDQTFDVLVADIGMPDMDGYELLQELRRRGRAPAAIAVTALTGEGDRRRASEAGFLAHLGKPVIADDLLQAIAQALRQRPAE